MSTARVYADVNVNRPPEYWDYENTQLEWSDQEPYEVIRKVGRGKYSEVFVGVDVGDGPSDKRERRCRNPLFSENSNA